MDNKKQEIERLADNHVEVYDEIDFLPDEYTETIKKALYHFKQLPWEVLEESEEGAELFSTMYHNFAHMTAGALPIPNRYTRQGKGIPEHGDAEVSSLRAQHRQFLAHLVGSVDGLEKLCEGKPQSSYTTKDFLKGNSIYDADPVAKLTGALNYLDEALAAIQADPDDLKDQMKSLSFTENPTKYTDVACQLIERTKMEQGRAEAIVLAEELCDLAMRYIFVKPGHGTLGAFMDGQAKYNQAAARIGRKVQALYRKGLGFEPGDQGKHLDTNGYGIGKERMEIWLDKVREREGSSE